AGINPMTAFRGSPRLRSSRHVLLERYRDCWGQAPGAVDTIVGMAHTSRHAPDPLNIADSALVQGSMVRHAGDSIVFTDAASGGTHAHGSASESTVFTDAATGKTVATGSAVISG